MSTFVWMYVLFGEIRRRAFLSVFFAVVEILQNWPKNKINKKSKQFQIIPHWCLSPCWSKIES
jgi:hypothetical protein